MKKSTEENQFQELTLGSLQKRLAGKERKMRIEFTSLTRREKNILMKTVKLQEEVGELANDVLSTLRLQRKSKLESFNKTNLYDEFGDVTIATLDLANALQVDMDRAVRKKLKKILKIYSKDR